MGYLRFLSDNWLLLLAGFLLSLTSSYGQTFFISIFAGQIMAAYGLTDGGWGGVYTLATTASAVVMVWAGALTDRFRIRALAVFVMIALAGACLMMTQSPGIWWLVATIFALRLSGQGMMSHLAVVAMARWFVATRGKALSIASTGFAAGTAILPIIFAALLLTVDWRWLWVGAAAIVLVTMPVIAALLRQERTPQSMAAEAQATGMNNRHWTRADVLRHPIFWLLIPALLGPPAWGTALFFQQVHLCTVKGWSHVAFVGLFPLLTAMTIAATFASGWAIDRFGSARLLPFYMLPFAAAFLWLGQAETIAGAAVGLAIFGIGQGLQSTLASAYWAEFFGTAHLGAIKAVAGAIMVFGSAIGPGISGLLIDQGITFPDQMLGISIYFLSAGVLGTLAAVMARTRLARLA
jgi:MFS family permease